ncbi:MAG: EAL domain-containing protein [Alphaproteobacteria bacterium]|nr:EAL domain-containing protein [Rhodospirillales bacterium]MCW9045564.1 EAL domain-containing protein [Alphaproteobacteria bacterium]
MDYLNKQKLIFDAAQVAIWEQDFTQVKFILASYRAAGISDLKQYLNENISLAWDLAEAVKTVDVNNAALKIFNASTIEDFGSSIHFTFTAATLKSFINQICAIWDGETFFREQVSIKALDGNDLEVLLSLPIPKTDADYKNVPVCIVDVTRSTLLYRELLKSEKQYADIIKNMPDVYYRTDAEGIIQAISPSAFDVVGIESHQLIGQRMTDYYVNSDDREELIKKLTEKPGETVVFEAYLRHKNGHNVYVSSKTRLLLDPSNQVIGVEGIARDVTEQNNISLELQLSDQRLKTTIQGAPVVLFSFDPDGIITLSEGKGLTALGLEQGELVGQSIFDLYDDETILENTRKALAGQNVTSEVTLNGVIFSTALTPVIENEKLIGVIGVSTEITKQKQAEESYRQLFQNSQAIELLIDPVSGNIIDANLAAEEFYGYSIEKIKQLNISDINTMPRMMLDKEIENVVQGQRNQFDFKHKLASGEIRSVEVHASNLEINEHKLIHSIIFDITNRKETEDALQMLYKAVEQSPDAVMITDAEGIIEYVNPYFEEITGYQESEVIGKNPNILKSGETPQDTYKELWETITEGGIWRGELLNKKKNGDLLWEFASISPVYDDEGKRTHYVAIKENITEKKRQEEIILHQAYFDSVTDLPNRVLAVDRLSQAIKEANREKENVALLFIDLDDFKKVNDSLGHERGDQLLVKAAARLRSCVRDGDTVARHGGDEFLVILNSLKNPLDAETIAEKILSVMAEPFIIGDLDVVVTASIGLALYPNDGKTPSILLRNADTAMYRAKEEGRNTYHFFAKFLNDEAVQRLEMERNLQLALENDEFFLQYQPQIDSRTGKCVGAEALIRWQSPKHGLISPDQFIPTAEQLGLIIPIGEWALRTACKQAKQWVDEGAKGFKISVNVSPRQFRGYALVGAIELALGESGLPVECLEIEVTEGLMVHNRDETKNILNKLHDMGITISMDDFGTGYSSLSYLKDFPFDKLKIDRSFVDGVENDKENQALVTAASAMAKGLGLQVVAEGVETQDQLNFVSGHDCELIQGYFYSKPISPLDFTKLLKDM